MFRTVGCEGIYVATPSMEPTLPVDSSYFVDKFTYIFRDPRRGEIVSLDSPVDSEKGLIKRIIGLPNEKFSIKLKKVYINGALLSEPYTRFKRKDEILMGDNIEEIKIPPEAYFVMGDNRDESGDSRDWKDAAGNYIYFVKKEHIRGKLMNVLE